MSFCVYLLYRKNQNGFNNLLKEQLCIMLKRTKQNKTMYSIGLESASSVLPAWRSYQLSHGGTEVTLSIGRLLVQTRTDAHPEN